MSSAENRPNILLFVSDQHRYDWLQTNPEVPVRTPNLASLADRGVEFTNAVCPSPVCGPSRACLASGRDYDRAGAPGGSGGWTLSPEQPNYYRALRDEGDYYVAACGGADLGGERMYTEQETTLERFGFSDGVISAGKNAEIKLYTERGIRDTYLAYLEDRGLAETHVEDFRRRTDLYRDTFPTRLPEDAYADNWIARNGLALLEDAPADRPWHLAVNFSGPHEPMDVTREMHDWYRDPDVEFPAPKDPDEDLDPDTHQEIRRNYAAMIENIDRWIGEYLDRLEERGEREDTLVVFTSDHGDSLGDHGRWEKFSPYQASVGIPLVVAGPGVQPRNRCTQPVNLIDLQATILDYAGVDPLPGADSKSLRPLLGGETDDHREYVYAGFGAWRMVYDGTYKLVTGLDFERDHHEQSLAFLEDDSRSRRDAESEYPPVLFDVQAGERENLLDSRPERARELYQRLEGRVAGPEGSG